MEHAKELEYLWGTFSGEIWDFCYEVLDRFGENDLKSFRIESAGTPVCIL